MIKATAATVANDLVVAGYVVQVAVDSTGAYRVRAQSTSGPVSCSTIATFATSHGVTGQTDTAEFV